MKKTRKKILTQMGAAMLCIVMMVVFVACGRKIETSSKNDESITASQTSFIEMSNESAIEAAKDIHNKILKYSQKDYDEFAKLYRNTDEETIKSDFNTEYDFDDFDKVNYSVVCSKDNYYYICATYYLVTGTHPDTHMKCHSYAFGISYEKGGWKIENNETLINAINSVITDVYPKEAVESESNGFNAAVFSKYNYMYMDENAVYEGCTNTEVKFAWQDADGNVYVMLWFANGTDNNLYYTNCSFSLTDNNYGLICDVSTDVDIALKAHRSKMYTVVIPASEVLTGKSAWDSVSSSCDVKFK